jgi:hypothetical protein
MEALSPAGLTGALLGLVMGWVDYKIAGGIIERKLREPDGTPIASDETDGERRIQRFRKLLLMATVGVFPIVGYVFGRAIAG